MWEDMLRALAVPRHAAVVEQWTRAAVNEGVSATLRPQRPSCSRRWAPIRYSQRLVQLWLYRSWWSK